MKTGVRSGTASAGLLVALAAGAVVGIPHRGGDRWPAAVAREARFVETVVETGTLNAVRMQIYSAPLVGSQVKIVELAPEGSAVAAGTVLVRFDEGPLSQNLAREEAALRLAEAELERARQDARVEELRAQADLDAAQKQIGFAESGLANELDGRGKVALAEAEAAVSEAAREVARTRTAYEDTRPLLAEGFVTRAELERAEQNWRHAEEQQRLAAVRLAALTRYERPAAVDRSQAAVHEAREDLGRTTETVGARQAQRQATLGMARSRVEETRARIALLRDHISRLVIRADGAGLVVYRDLFFGSERRKPQVGDEVFANQQLIAVPDASRLVVETRVREVDLHKIADSQRVTVKVDAYPQIRLRASVTLVGALAAEDPIRTGVKYFPVTVTLRDTDPRLRPGMTAHVEIETATLERTVVIPLEALFEDQGRYYCVVAGARDPERRPVTVAGENATIAAIAGGLAVGDRVLLVDPFSTRDPGGSRPVASPGLDPERGR